MASHARFPRSTQFNPADPLNRRVGSARRDPTTNNALPGEVNQYGRPMGSSTGTGQPMSRNSMTPEEDWRRTFPRPQAPSVAPSLASSEPTPRPVAPSAGGAINAGLSGGRGAPTMAPNAVPLASPAPPRSTGFPGAPIVLGGSTADAMKLLHPTAAISGANDPAVKVAQAGGTGDTPYGPIQVGHTMTPRDAPLMTGAPMPTRTGAPFDAPPASPTQSKAGMGDMRLAEATTPTPSPTPRFPLVTAAGNAIQGAASRVAQAAPGMLGTAASAADALLGSPISPFSQMTAAPLSAVVDKAKQAAGVALRGPWSPVSGAMAVMDKGAATAPSTATAPASTRPYTPPAPATPPPEDWITPRAGMGDMKTAESAGFPRPPFVPVQNRPSMRITLNNGGLSEPWNPLRQLAGIASRAITAPSSGASSAFPQPPPPAQPPSPDDLAQNKPKNRMMDKITY